MMDDRIFTVILDWLAFTVPKASGEEIGELLGGEWFENATGFRGYPTCWMTNQSRHGVGKLGTGAPRNPKEVHVDLSAGIVSTWEESKIRSVLTWVFQHGGHITRMDVALDDRGGTGLHRPDQTGRRSGSGGHPIPEVPDRRRVLVAGWGVDRRYPLLWVSRKPDHAACL